MQQLVKQQMHQQHLKNNPTKLHKKAVVIITAFFIFACDFTPPVNRKIIDAQKYITNQDYTKAAYLYQEILKNNLDIDLKIKINYQLGELYSIYLGEYKKAEFHYNEVKNISEDPLMLIKLEEKIADIQFNYTKNYLGAINSYKKLIEIKPRLKMADSYEYDIARSYYKLNEADKSLEKLKEIQLNTNHEFFVKSFYLMGLIYYEIKDYPKALFVWTEYLKRETDKNQAVETTFLIASIYEATENLKQAYEIYKSILKEYPNEEVIQNRMKSLYERRVSRRR